jgi:hypothetical protein
MKTKPIMQRDFYDSFVCQRTKDGFFNATEFLKRFNEISDKQMEMREFWKNKNTDEFLKALDIELLPNRGNSPHLEGTDSELPIKTYETTRGNKGATWMHPYLFVKFAMWLSPALEVKIIKWVYDHLIEFRLLAGDHYKEMCDAIAWRYYQYYKKTAGPDVFMDEAHLLNQLVFGRPNGNQRNIATEKQLDLMNRLQVANIKMIRENFSRGQREKNLKIFKELYD